MLAANSTAQERLNDAHCHFLSAGFFDTLAKDSAAPAVTDPAVELPTRLGWDPPGSPESLADRWVAELDRHHIHRAALMASVPNDEDSVALAVSRHPTRLVGMTMLNPTAPGATERAEHAVAGLGLRSICLFPAMHHFSLDDDHVAAIFQVASDHKAAIFVHCGVLSIGARKKLGLPSRFDIRLGDPLALIPVASTFPTVTVIIPHFGAGFFRETLMAADLCSNIHVDTSSSNAWTKYVPPIRLADVFRRTIEVLGPDRVLFGSDSSFFPRGWQMPVYDAQRKALAAIDADVNTQQAIFKSNFDRVFGPIGC